MQTLRNHSTEIQEFLGKKNQIKILPLGKGHTSAPVLDVLQAIYGESFFCEGHERHISRNAKQKSQKVRWTRGVRQDMAKTIQHREHATLIREGKIRIGAGLMEELLMTGTNN